MDLGRHAARIAGERFGGVTLNAKLVVIHTVPQALYLIRIIPEAIISIPSAT